MTQDRLRLTAVLAALLVLVSRSSAIGWVKTAGLVLVAGANVINLAGVIQERRVHG